MKDPIERELGVVVFMTALILVVIIIAEIIL
jgi:hypothetical protein